MKKVLALVLVAVLTLGMLAGCGNGNKETDPPKGSESGNTSDPVELTFWYWADNTDYSALMQKIVKEFNETNGKGITVKAEEQPWDGGGYSNTLLNACMGGGGPDLATFKLTAAPSFIENNKLADLTDMIAAWDGKDDIDENIYNVMKQASDDGKIYLMPWNIQVLYVYYRPSYFKAVGIDVPKTYEEFLTAIEKCTTTINGKEVKGFGMRGAKGGQEPWGSFIAGRGGSFDDLTSAESIQGMQDFIDIYKKGYVPQTATNDGFQEIIAGFKSGQTAMTIHHTGSSAQMEEIFGDDVSAFAFPAGKGQWTSMGDTEIVMMESCKNKEAAFEFLKFMSTGSGEEQWCKGTGNVPVSKTVQKDAFFQDNRFMKASIEGQSFAGIVPIETKTSEWISDTWPATVSQALLEQISAEECMKKLKAGLFD